MKIGPSDSKPNPLAGAAVSGERTSAARKASTPPEASAQVALSTAASLRAAGQADPTFDSAKVERIATAIRDGEFKINAEVIADKLIINAKELLGSKPS